MELIKGKYFRVSTLINLLETESKIENGLAIEEKIEEFSSNNSPVYIVVGFLKYNPKTDDIKYEDIGFRTLAIFDGSNEFRDEFVYSVNLAKNYLYYYMKIKNSMED